MKKIGFIGTGNMGSAMMKGCLSVFSADDLTFFEVSDEAAARTEADMNVKRSHSLTEMIANVNYIVMAVKPQVYPAVLASVKGKISKKQVLISIAPSYSIQMLKDALGEEVRIVRAMPNTPAMVLEGMSGVCFSEDVFTEEEKTVISAYFTSFGKMEIVPEHLMNAVTVASGSSPAFVYMFIEALADSAVRYGMPRDKAVTFAAQAVMGSAKMVLETKEHPGKLKDNVCSPGGTTIDGVAVLERKGMRSAVIDACEAVYNKCTSM